MDWLPVLSALGVGGLLAAVVGGIATVQSKRIDSTDKRLSELIDTQQEQLTLAKAEVAEERKRRRQAERRVEILLRHIRDLEEWLRAGAHPPPPVLPIDEIWGDDA